MKNVQTTVKTIHLYARVRVQKLLKREKRGGEEVVTGRIHKHFLDVTVVTIFKNGTKTPETFTGHTYRGQLRIMMPSAVTGERESWDLEKFTAFAERRWKVNHKRVVRTFTDWMKGKNVETEKQYAPVQSGPDITEVVPKHVVRFRCEKCYKLVPKSDLITINDEERCLQCRKMFYVVACEPDRESRLHKLLTKTAGQKGMRRKFGKIVVPRHSVAKETKRWYVAYDKDGRQVMAKDWRSEEMKPARVSAETDNDALWLFKQQYGDEYDVRTVELHDAGGKIVLRSERSHPGYLIVEMEFDHETFQLIEDLRPRGVWGILPMKIALGGMRYPRKEPAQKTKPKKWEQEHNAEWVPTALDSEEAARILIAEKEKAKEKEVKKHETFQPGDQVRITLGNFAKMEGKVLKQVEENVHVELTIMQRPVVVPILKSQLVKVS